MYCSFSHYFNKKIIEHVFCCCCIGLVASLLARRLLAKCFKRKAVVRALLVGVSGCFSAFGFFHLSQLSGDQYCNSSPLCPAIFIAVSPVSWTPSITQVTELLCWCVSLTLQQCVVTNTRLWKMHFSDKISTMEPWKEWLYSKLRRVKVRNGTG